MKDILRRHNGLLGVLAAYVVVAVLYGATIPIFETPDANGHYAYIHELTEGRGLPILGRPSGERVTGYVAGHEPLYYALCAAATFWVEDDVDFGDWAWFNPHHAMGNAAAVANKNRLIHTDAEAFPWRGTPLTMHISRLVSTALGALAVVSAYGIALELFPERRWLALGAAALTAFNPMFIFTTARVSNDAAAVACGSLAVWCAVRLTVRGLSWRGLALTGFVLGLAALSKLSCLAFFAVVALALLLDAFRAWRRQAQQPVAQRLGWIAARWALVGLVALAVGGWWYVRNWILYGEPTGTEAWLSNTATVRPEPIGFFEVVPFLKDLELSYWAMFGWFNIAAAQWMYWLWWVLVRLAAVGLVVIAIDQGVRRRLRRDFARPVLAGLAVLCFAILLIFGSVWRFIMIVLGAQGRYLTPVTAAISVLLMLGLSRLLPRRWTPGLAVLLGVGHLVLALVCLFAFILPAYAPPEVVQESDLPTGMMRFDLTYEGTAIQLLGGHVETESAHPGGEVAVSLYWRALEQPREDPVAYIQILGRGGDPIAGVDCYPGRGNFPATLWQPGVIYQDRYVLPLAPGAEAPVIAALHAGLRQQGGPRLSALLPSGLPAPDPVLLDLVPIRPAAPLSEQVAYSVDARIGESIRLVGYDLSTAEVRPGETLTVTLVWRVEDVPPADYTVFVHLLDEEGALVAQDDHPPLGGEYRTSFWARGDVVRDVYRLVLDTDLPPCACTLLVGMYDPLAKARVPAFDGLGRPFEGNAILAGGVAVR